MTAAHRSRCFSARRAAARGALALAAAAMVAGCGHATPSQELVSARATYQEAAEGQAKDSVPDKLLDARQALDAAERAFDDDENSPRSRTLAYVAQRKALLAIAEAGISASKKLGAEADREYRELLEVVAKRSRERLGKTQEQLAHEKQVVNEKNSQLSQRDKELAAERQAREDAEKKLAAAMKSLQEIANVKEDARGTVITLSGAVLFRTNQASLLPIAKQQLLKVAQALNAYDEGRKIVVEGHTDSRGSAESNRRLSQARAESVRAFLIENGVDADRISAVGKGEDEPIADNRTAEGRANNRRVEIIVAGAKASGSR